MKSIKRRSVRSIFSIFLFASSFLTVLYAAHQKLSLFDEPYAARFIDLSTGTVKIADPALGFIESIVAGPTRVEFDFKECMNANLFRLFVGPHGRDSTQRLPAKWQIYTKGDAGDWLPSGDELTSSNYQNERWYSFPLQSSSCIRSLAFDVSLVSGSNVLRIYRIQAYQLPFKKIFAPIFDGFTSLTAKIFGAITYLLHPIPFDPAMLMALVGIFAFDAGIKGWRDSMAYRLLIKRSKSTNRDIICFFLNITGLLYIATAVYSVGGNYLTKIYDSLVTGWLKHQGFLINTGSVILDIFFYLLIITFFDYWLHRLIHMSRFWPLHRFHHSATEFNGITVFRNHPALFAFESIIKIWPIVFFPIAPQVTPYWAVATFLFWSHQVITHSDLNWKFGWLGRWVLVSPALHKVHHSSNPNHYNKNYGNLFIIWDRLFGTYLQVPPQTISLGNGPEDEYMSQKWTIAEWALDMINLVRLNLGFKCAVDDGNFFKSISKR